MMENQQTKKAEQPKAEPQRIEKGAAARSSDAGDNNKGRGVDLNTSGRFDSAAGKQAVAEHFKQSEAKKPEAQDAKGGDGGSRQQRSGESSSARDLSRNEAANAARVSSSDHNNRPREGLTSEGKPKGNAEGAAPKSGAEGKASHTGEGNPPKGSAEGAAPKTGAEGKASHTGEGNPPKGSAEGAALKTGAEGKASHTGEGNPPKGRAEGAAQMK
jgi:hypothetical protein